ncbi:MAG: DUF2071 domain-containing protein [Verrucomicrobia bacterium]|jgi:uncharacterized protein|nr:DUF2071 domain-containing protein [Verrucomicrobiota bacterium]
MHPSLFKTDHRPWPLPSQRWKWRQSWLDLAFLHYPVSIEEIKQLLPERITIDTFGGKAWIGLVPFRMSGVMKRPFPNIPFFSSFLELNLRTYVVVDGKPGVWFFSLDTNSYPFVIGGRGIYNLPYHFAKCSIRKKDDWFEFKSHRKEKDFNFQASYRSVGTEFYAKQNSFEHWSTERYCLYSSTRKGTLHRVEVHHEQWPLQRAEVNISTNDIIRSTGISVIDENPICHFSRGVNVISYGKERCQDSTGSSEELIQSLNHK